MPPVALETSYTYDPVGNRTSGRNPRGVVSRAEYNQLNEPIVVTRGADVTPAVKSGELVSESEPFAFLSRLQRCDRRRPADQQG